MLYKDEDGKTRKIKKLEFPPPVSQIFKHSEYWNKRALTWNGEKIYFDQPIRTGDCYFCQKEGRPNRSKTTLLHHVKYDNDDPLEWTIEVCISCHSRIDKRYKKILQKYFAPRDFNRAVDKEAENRAYIERESYKQKMIRLQARYKL